MPDPQALILPADDGFDRASADALPVLRRQWLGCAARATAGLVAIPSFLASGVIASGLADPLKTAAAERDDAYLASEAKVRKATTLPLHTASSEHYRALGDASESFMKLVLSDCEVIALDYLEYFRGKGFDVALPNEKMTVVVFVDERSFMRFIPEIPPQVTGLYRRSDNCLVLFDFRNVPMRQLRASRSNMSTLAHEATHLLNFNTGLLNRKGDAPRSVIEGLATFSEVRRSYGRTPPGQINLTRLDDLAHIQRRRQWIPVEQLLHDDAAAFGNTVDQVLLAYAESWFLVYHLMTVPERLSQFRQYLKAIASRKDDLQRLEDARTHFGDLSKLDREVHLAAVQMQRDR